MKGKNQRANSYSYTHTNTNTPIPLLFFLANITFSGICFACMRWCVVRRQCFFSVLTLLLLLFSFRMSYFRCVIFASMILAAYSPRTPDERDERYKIREFREVVLRTHIIFLEAITDVMLSSVPIYTLIIYALAKKRVLQSAKQTSTKNTGSNRSLCLWLCLLSLFLFRYSCKAQFSYCRIQMITIQFRLVQRQIHQKFVNSNPILKPMQHVPKIKCKSAETKA